jgi:hypothetical protein
MTISHHSRLVADGRLRTSIQDLRSHGSYLPISPIPPILSVL